MTEFFFILDRNDPWKRISALSARNVAKRDSVDDEERGGAPGRSPGPHPWDWPRGVPSLRRLKLSIPFDLIEKSE